VTGWRLRDAQGNLLGTVHDAGGSDLLLRRYLNGHGVALPASVWVMPMAPEPLNAADHTPGTKAGQFIARMPDSLRAKLAVAARRRGISEAAVLREALTDYLERAIAEEVEADLAAEFGDPGGEP
jgi:hypothetical protein